MALFNTPKKQHIPTITDRFIVNPFSVLRKVTGPWQDRKQYWDSYKFNGIVGRDTKRYNAMPVNIGGAQSQSDDYVESISSFDPVLCEIAYAWFSKPGDKIIDPFAGGSTRGITASILGRKYIGIDLSTKQVLANQTQYYEMEPSKFDGSAEWITGDSEFALDQIEDGTCQMLFTCPPYYNLEQYTHDKRDLSKQRTYEAFLDKYTTILTKAVAKVDEGFIVIVVGEVRNPATGEYYGLVPDTINIFRQTGVAYYNELIIEDPIGSLPIRGIKYFKQSRKIGKHHQNMLVFYKGDLSKIRIKSEQMNISNNIGE